MGGVSHPITPAEPSTLVGWREWVGLPGAGVDWLKAKVDTGAQTSSLHAFGLREFTRDGEPWVRFEVHPWQRSADDAVQVELPVHDRRRVRSSSGHAERRVVVLMDVRLLDRVIRAEVTLTRRDAMGFRMLVGRELLRNGFLVDAAGSYLGGKPPRAVRRANKRPAVEDHPPRLHRRRAEG
ncbi:ATP-dependent zinc protease family protein [Microbacterium marinilacus]|uniref:RimK/LysX family protein n=1 Tax=Microbacterium marinilacus TaxID=415209 RepID=A0ABP7BCQ7_9MICO|nr:RimK/LysX family protein [Microbacterium marinilacus]MBY0689349.1 RimK/LysX family protein [Microbacterium marinilacus]